MGLTLSSKSLILASAGPHLLSDDFKITRTYALTAALSPYNAFGVAIHNKLFSDMPGPGNLVQFTIEETISKDLQDWRRACYDKPRTWEQTGPMAGDVNVLARRRLADQKQRITDSVPSGKVSFLARCSSKALSLNRSEEAKSSCCAPR